MTGIISKNPLVQKIADATASEDIKNMLVGKHLPFTEEEYLESLVFLLKEKAYQSQCINHLQTIPESVKANYVRKHNANPRVMYYVLRTAIMEKNSKLVSHISRNRSVPVEFLLKIAESGTTDMLEILVENQIKMIAFPDIMEKMEKNPQINNYIKGKITEIRQFYLTNDTPEEIPEEHVIEDAKEIVASGDTSEQEEAEADHVDGNEEYEKEALSLLQIINQMTTSERIKLALTGSRSHRMILIKDPNKLVSLSVLESPKLSINEVSMLVKNRSVSSDVITRISTNRDWIKNYEIVLELVQNPKTPVSNALGFIKRLHLKDLMKVVRDKNISPVIRNMAQNFQREKSKLKK